MNTNVKLVPRSPDGVAHVVLIGRVSTTHQNISNIDASYDVVRPILKGIWNGPAEFKEFGEQGSGMLIDRASIRAAVAEIERGWPDLVLMEDCSRSYRNPEYLIGIVYDCVDAGIRVIAPGDNLDTAEDGWENALLMAALRHGMTIPETRRRVRRTATSAFHKGGMVIKARFGYMKLTKEQADKGEFGPKGLRIAKDPARGSAIEQIRQWIVFEKRRPQAIIQWLYAQNLRPGRYVKSGRWSKRVLLDLLQDPILHGWRRFRRTVYKQILNTGKHRRNKNASPEIEHVPELAYMTEEEWKEMQAALKSMGYGCHHGPSGDKNPRFQIPRDNSIVPLQHARCAICEEFYYLTGADVIKCKDALPRNGSLCWNHVIVPRKLIREELVDLLLERINRCPGAMQQFQDAAWQQIIHTRNRGQQSTESLDREIADLHAKMERITNAIERGGEGLESLIERLKTLQQQLNDAKRRRDKQAQDAGTQRQLSRADFDIAPREALLELASTSFEFADLLRRIIPLFVIQPVQALDSGQVRPRAILKLDLSKLFPEGDGTAYGNCPPPEEIPLELFDPPEHIKHIQAVVKLKAEKLARNEKCSLKILAAELKINYMTVKRALGYKKLMDAAGMTEPWRVLTEPPKNASRWRPHRPREGRGR